LRIRKISNKDYNLNKDACVKEKDIKKQVKNQIVELDLIVLNSGLEVAQLAEILNIILIGKLGE